MFQPFMQSSSGEGNTTDKKDKYNTLIEMTEPIQDIK
jgi:hypothetical protein